MMAESAWRMGQWQAFPDREPSAGNAVGTSEAICGCLKVLLILLKIIHTGGATASRGLMTLDSTGE